MKSHLNLLSCIAFITTKNKLLLQKKYDTAKGNISNHIDKGFYFLNEFADNKFARLYEFDLTDLSHDRFLYLVSLFRFQNRIF